MLVDTAAMLQQQPELDENTLRERLLAAVKAGYAARVQRYGEPVMRHVEQQFLLQTLDRHWREHLAAMDYLRQGIHLRGYAQKDWRYEFKREAFEMFSAMLGRVKYDTAAMLSKVEVKTQDQIEAEEEARRQRLMQQLQAQHAEAHSALEAASVAERGPDEAAGGQAGRDAMEQAMAPFVRGERKVGRNEACPCGSGKKFKHCHGALSDG